MTSLDHSSGGKSKALIVTFHEPLKAFRRLDTTNQACQAKTHTRPFPRVSEVGQTLLVESQGFLTIALQPGHVPESEEGTADTRKVVKFLEQG